MNNSTSHLTAATAKALALPDAERIERIRTPRWIGYPRAKAVLDKLEDLLAYSKSHRMPNLLILETAVGAVKVRQVAAAPEDSGGGSVTHLELLRSSRNRPESRANARIPPLSTPCNCGL